MKKRTNHLFAIVLAAALAVIPTACSDEYDDVAPGSYVDMERIETFPGDVVLLTGQISNGSPITTVTIGCDAWNIHQTYDRMAYKDYVFNYEYRFEVPADAKFNQTLIIKATSENGNSTVREIPVTFLPDTSAPTVTSTLNDQIAVDFDPTEGKGVWNLNMTLADDRALESAVVSIPSLSVAESFVLTGKTASVEKTFEFTTPGTYPCEISITDASGNKGGKNVELMVMVAEVENPVQDYAGMYLVNASENPEDYVDGYYVWMDRQGEYQYQGKFHATTDNFKLFFTPERSLDGDLFGVSPYVSSKLMNNNGYVVPATVEKAGYYGVWIDLQAHSFSVWPLDTPENLYSGTLRVSGTGFTFGDWGLPDEDMAQNGYVYTYQTALTEGYAGDKQYYFYSPDWAHVFRADAEGKWWFEAASGACVIFHTEYSGNVLVSFDTFLPWATIKKID